jgi:bifunctional non-homologous end joining protein LigD
LFPQPLVRVAEPFDHPDWLFELKYDGFRGLAYVENGSCTLVSRRGHVFKQFQPLCVEVARSVRKRAVIDGEIVCLRPDGSCDFNSMLFRRGTPFFHAFDLLSTSGRDLCKKPLYERKERLRDLLGSPREGSRLRYVDHVEGRGRRLYEAVCKADAEGVVAKWRLGTYQTDGVTTSWLKVKNPTYTQEVGRRELFEDRWEGHRPRERRPEYRLDPALPGQRLFAQRQTRNVDRLRELGRVNRGDHGRGA